MSIQQTVSESPLVVYSSSWCPYCQKVLSALKSAGLQPKVIEVDGTLKSQLSNVSGQSSVPQVFVNGTFIGGCNDGPEAWMGTLPLLNSGKLKQMLDTGSKSAM